MAKLVKQIKNDKVPVEHLQKLLDKYEGRPKVFMEMVDYIVNDGYLYVTEKDIINVEKALLGYD